MYMYQIITLYTLDKYKAVCQFCLNKTEAGKDYRLYDSNNVKFWKKRNYGDSERVRG